MTQMPDDYNLVNPVLRQVMRGIYEQRTSFPIMYYCDTRLERVNNKFFSQMFFMSRGCSHDLKGGCTMCNYGYGKEQEIDSRAVLAEIKKKASELPKHLHELVVGPTGSLLDEEEVPAPFFSQVLDTLSGIECDEFTCETRADSVTKDKLKMLKEKIHSPKITLELGVESIDQWCLRNCINKNTSFKRIEEAIQVAHAEDVQICGNIGIGFPFVNEAYSIYSAVTSIRKLLEMNVSCVTLFAYNIRPGTLLEWLWRRGMYKCTSLWGIVEVLSHFTDEELKRIQISWYRNYYTDKSKILQMPYLCSNCEEDVLTLFDEYRNEPCMATLQPLISYDCCCKKDWYEQYKKQSSCVDFVNVKHAYSEMAKEFSVPTQLLEKELYYMESSLSRKE